MRNEETKGEAPQASRAGDEGDELRSKFEDLRVWQASRELAKGVYRACRSQRLSSDRVLVDQMTRAAVSIVSNIAEGHERGSRSQNMEFCFYAKGSVGELRSQVILARDVDLLDERAYVWLHEKCEIVAQLLASYLRHMRCNPRPRNASVEKTAQVGGRRRGGTNG